MIHSLDIPEKKRGGGGICFSPVLVVNRVSILADFGLFAHKQGVVFAL